MTRLHLIAGAAAVAMVVSIGATLAQTPAPGAKQMPKGKPKVATTEIGKQCSAEADAKGLHGKERQKFRRACAKAAKSKAK